MKETLRWAYQAAMATALLCAAISLSCAGGPDKSAQAQGAPPAMPVKVAVAQLVPVSSSSDYVATLKSRNSAVVMPEVEGRITNIFVHSGDHVSAGARLMQIDPAKQLASVSAQEHSKAAELANLEYAKQQYQRSNSLYSAGVVSKQELDQAKSALDATQAQWNSLDSQLEQQRVQLHYYSVVSPSGGIVGDVPVRVGDRVTSTTTLTTVDKPGSLEAYVYVPIERSAALNKNMPVQIVDAQGQVLADSRISFISPEVDTSTQSILVKAQIANSNDKLRTAQYIRARVIWGSQRQPVVPVLAVSRIGAQYFAFVAEDQNGKLVAHQKPLRLGDMVGNDYAVLDGIKAGDKIIVSGTQFLVDGAPVIPQS